jgi:hypothetical protein
MRSRRLSAILSAIVIVSACQSSPPAPSASPAPSPTTAVPVLPPTSEVLIAAALKEGKITQEQSLLYRALALFDSPGLPAEYRSPIADMEAAGDLLHEIDIKESSLGAETLKKLAPYRVRPSDPTSIFNTTPSRTGLGGGLGAAAIILAADVAPVWKSKPAAGGKALVWVKDSAGAQADLDKYATMVSQVWAAYPGIFTYPVADKPNIPSKTINPDAAIDFYFINVGDLDPRRAACVADPTEDGCALAPRLYGYAVRVLPYPGHTSSGSLVIDSGRTDDDLIDTIAHELAHASQFAYDTDESSWLMESTATWVAYKVDKKLGKVPSYQYRWFPQFFKGLDEPLTREADGNSYAAWLYFQFAAMEAGDGVVTDIWKAAAADGEQGYKAADTVFAFANHFADFTVRNWNDDPVKPEYKSVDDTFPGHQPDIRNSVKTLEGGKKDELDAHLPPLAAGYFQYDFPAAVRDVTFENSLLSDPEARVWAMKKVKGEWKAPEEWTASAKKTLCRDIPEDDVTSLILVVSNVSTVDDLTVDKPPTVTAGTKGCAGWSGTMTATGSWGAAGARTHGSGTATFTGIWILDDTYDSGCDPTSTEACPNLYRPTGTIAWTWDSHITDTRGKPTCDITTSGSLPAGQERYPERPIQVLQFRQADPEHLQYWGGGYFDPPQLKCPNTINGETIPYAFFEIDSRASVDKGPQQDGSTCFNTDWRIETTATTISGSCQDFSFPNNRNKFEWNLTRIGPAPGN